MSSKSYSSDFINQTMKTITSLNDNFAANIILMMIIVIVILGLCYYYYMSTLLSKECTAMDNLYYQIDGNIKSLNPKDDNCGYTFKDYYIKTAYNACSAGTYRNDYVSICALKDVLRQGVRGLDFEIYSLSNQPVVATSTTDNYYIKETYNYVPFADVINTIKNYAFSNSTSPNPRDPIILHLRIKSNNQSMYQNLANIFKSQEQLFLGPQYSFENNNQNLGDIPLLNLSGKIIVIVDKFNNSYMDNNDFYEYVNMTSNSIFMRALTYYNVKNTPDIVELQEYNKKNMTIAIPDTGASPPNPSGLLVRESGCQMIAQRFQLDDVYLQENNQFFDQAGYAFALKPENLRYVPITVPTPPPADPALSYQSRNVSSDYYAFTI